MIRRYFVEKHGKKISWYDNIENARKDAKRINGTVGVEEIETKFEKWLRKPTRFVLFDKIKGMMKYFYDLGFECGVKFYKKKHNIE